MKRIALLIGLTFLAGVKVFAQSAPLRIVAPIEPVRVIVAEQQAAFSNLPPTHIQTSNESFQNNSQFMNKDNFIDPDKVYTTSNGTYWTPGYNNPANRNYNTEGLGPNTSVNPVNQYIQQSLRSTSERVIIPTNTHVIRR